MLDVNKRDVFGLGKKSNMPIVTFGRNDFPILCE